MKHEHVFKVHVGIKVFGGAARAWIEQYPPHDEAWPSDVFTPLPEMWRCIDCGEQGYEVRL